MPAPMMATVNFRSGARFAFVQPGARGSSDVIASSSSSSGR